MTSFDIFNCNNINEWTISPSKKFDCISGVVSKATNWTKTMIMIMKVRKYPELILKIEESIKNDPQELYRKNSAGFTVLHLACANYNTVSTIECIYLLLNFDEQFRNNEKLIDLPCNYLLYNKTPFEYMFDYQWHVDMQIQICPDIKLINAIINKHRPKLTNRCLTKSIEMNSIELVKYFLDNGFVLENHHLFCSTKFDMLKFMMDLDVDVNTIYLNKNILSNLLEIKTISIDTIKLVLEHGIDINYGLNNNDLTSIQCNINYIRYDVLELLLANGAIVDTNDFIPLIKLCQNCKLDKDAFKKFKILIDYGAIINRRNIDGNTCLHLLCRNTDKYSVKATIFLINKDTKIITFVNNNNEQLIDICLKYNNTDILELLLYKYHLPYTYIEEHVQKIAKNTFLQNIIFSYLITNMSKDFMKRYIITYPLLKNYKETFNRNKQFLLGEIVIQRNIVRYHYKSIGFKITDLYLKIKYNNNDNVNVYKEILNDHPDIISYLDAKENNDLIAKIYLFASQ